MLILNLLSLLCLTGIVWFDFKNRKIPLVLFIGELLILSITTVLQYEPFIVRMIILNIGLASLQVGLLILWFKIRKRNLHFFRDAFGIGDFLMLGLASFFYPTPSFVWLILLSSALALIYGFVSQKQRNRPSITLIPLAGIMAALLIIQHVLSISQQSPVMTLIF